MYITAIKTRGNFDINKNFQENKVSLLQEKSTNSGGNI